jgi:hypothetical protein
MVAPYQFPRATLLHSPVTGMLWALEPSPSGRRLRQTSTKDPDHLTENGK